MINFFKSQQVIHGLNQVVTELNQRITDLESELQRQQEQNLSLIEKAEELQHKVNTLNIENSSQHKINENMSKMLREQTRADLLLNALEAVGLIPSAKTEKEHQEQHESLLSRLNNPFLAQQQQASRTQQSMFGGIFGGL